MSDLKKLRELPSGSTSRDGVWWEHHPTVGDMQEKIDELVDTVNTLIDVLKDRGLLEVENESTCS